MRLWSIHPRYLDSKGLVALWREALLAQAVLAGKTKGYTKHPQLDRFKNTEDQMAAIGAYLLEIYDEACLRDYCFDASKILSNGQGIQIKVSLGQLKYEWNHFLNKLRLRDPQRFEIVRPIKNPAPHPLFLMVKGQLEPWERTKL
jgi:hypothetical protein